jgi:ferrous iron transport protein A
MMTKQLTELNNKQIGKILSIEGGTVARNKLEALGIRPGKNIRKVSTQVFKGPVLIDIDGRDYALGHNLARKIVVEID